MVKLTDAQTRTLIAVNDTGKLPKGTRPVTVEKLNEFGLIIVQTIGDETTYTLTGDGLRSIGLEPPTVVVDEIQEELNTNPWDVQEASKPFVVQELIGNTWMRFGRSAATWGTANVWRNRVASQGLTVRVHNTITDQVWA